jgi:hypothetical protein
MADSMRTLISLLMLAFMTIGLPGLQATAERAAVAAPAPVRSVQARAKKKGRARPAKAKKAEKKSPTPKKNDRGFEL